MVACNSLSLRVGADHVTGVVNERDERQCVGVAPFHESACFVGGGAVYLVALSCGQRVKLQFSQLASIAAESQHPTLFPGRLRGVFERLSQL